MKPLTNKELIKRLHLLGFECPFIGGKHKFILKGKIRLTVPNPHRKEISVDLLARILRQAGKSKEEWIK